MRECLAIVAAIAAAAFAAGYRDSSIDTIALLKERNAQLEARVSTLREQAELCRIKKGGTR
jgi:cellobiose phosphorylase